MATRQTPGTIKTYIVTTDGGMDAEPRMRQFRGTFRQMLLHVARTYGYGYHPEENGRLTDINLRRMVEETNGDGCAYVMVWCVDDARQVVR